MPFTPYHFGPSGFLGLVFKKWIDIPVFVLANVIIDIEVLIALSFRLQWVHGYCHTLLGGALVGLLWGICAYPLRNLFKKIMYMFRITYATSFWKMVLSGVLGTLFHVLIDGIYHFDVQVFWPSRTLSLPRIIKRICGYYISRQLIVNICIVTFLAAVFLYVLSLNTFARKFFSKYWELIRFRKRYLLILIVTVLIITGALIAFSNNSKDNVDSTLAEFSPGSTIIIDPNTSYQIIDDSEIKNPTSANKSDLSKPLAVIIPDLSKDEDLLGYWKFDEGRGTIVKDSSENGMNGAIIGAGWKSSTKGYVLDFDGIDDYVKFDSDLSLDNLTAVTMIAWIYPRADSHWHVLDKGDGDKRIYAEGIKRVLDGRIRYSDMHAFSESKKNTVILNTWQHVALTWSRKTNKVRLFHNGLEVEYRIQDIGSGNVVDDSDYPYTIGTRGALGAPMFFAGYIDEVQLYKRVLSPQEIQTVYNWSACKYSQNLNR